MVFYLPILVYGVIFLGLISYLKYRYSNRKFFELAKAIPGLPELPLIGSAHYFAGSTQDILKSVQKVIDASYEHDGLVKLWLGPMLYTLCVDPDTVSQVLNTEMAKDPAYRFAKKWIGDGLIAGPVDIWKRHRKLLAPTFSNKIVDSFIDIFTEQSELLIEKLEQEVGKGQFNIYTYISPCTLDFVCESAMGVKVQAQEHKNTSWIQAGMREMELVNKQFFQIWLQPDIIFNLTSYARQEKKDLKLLKKFTSDVIQQKRQEFNEKQKNAENGFEHIDEERPKFKAFLELMMELSDDGVKLTDKEVREEVDTVTIAGNDSTAHASGYVLAILGYMPHIQDKVVEELRDIFKNSNRRPTKEDLHKMEYLDRVIKETLRLFPAIPLIVRRLKNDVQGSKYTLPGGSGCVIALLGLHKNKKYWGDNVDEFDPDRFLPENSAKRHPYAYIPFSAGARNCIGKQFSSYAVKTLISTILRSYIVHSDVDYKKMPLTVEVVLKSVNGYLVSLKKRDDFYI